MNKTYAIILAGGRGSRLGKDRPKQFLPLGDKPLIIKTIESFHLHGEIDNLIITLPEEYINELDYEINNRDFNKISKVVKGGITRQESVYNSLKAHDFNKDDIILLHDAARPFVSKDIITKIIKAVKEYGSAGTYVKAIDTITEIESGFVKSIPSRDLLYYTQTPQGFLFKIIFNAHEKSSESAGITITDDVSLVVKAGYRVKMVEGNYSNIKITTENDYNYAIDILKNK